MERTSTCAMWSFQLNLNRWLCASYTYFRTSIALSYPAFSRRGSNTQPSLKPLQRGPRHPHMQIVALGETLHFTEGLQSAFSHLKIDINVLGGRYGSKN